jgi:hypothetical protein
MARLFSTLGESIDKFLKLKTYQLHRTARINVNGGDVQWYLETSLDHEGKVDSELSVNQDFEQESFKVTTKKNASPEFRVITRRVKEAPVTLKLADPEVTVDVDYRKKSFSVDGDATFNWSDNSVAANLSANYKVRDNLNVGGSVTVKKDGPESDIAVTDYGVAVEFQHNDRQKFAFTTDKKLQVLKVGAEVGFRKDYTGYAQVSFDHKKQVDNLGYRLGLQYRIDGNSYLNAVYRDDRVFSALYRNRLPNNNVDASLAFNYSMDKLAAERVSLEWKLIFG